MTKNDGGPAFPRQNDDQLHAELGMTLLDWFAGQALAGLLTSDAAIKYLRNDAIKKNVRPRAHIAARAYIYADAMIAEREKPNE